MRRIFPIAIILLLFALIAMVIWIANHSVLTQQRAPKPSMQSEIKQPPPTQATASESLLVGYGDSATPAIEDLRKLHRVGIGYFSLIKNSQRHSIGGNEDFSSALQGENPNREIFIQRNHPVFSKAGLLIDRWGSPVIVHPEAWRQLELRSAGPDRTPYTEDDLVLSPAGVSTHAN
jgi:hypothetical protein